MSTKERINLTERTSSITSNILSGKLQPSKFPVLRSKGRALICKDSNKELIKPIIGKGALERQRENASKLASGRSVVDKSNKENEVVKNKSLKPQIQTKILPPTKSIKLRPVLQEKSNKLVKSQSIISLIPKDEVKKEEKQEKTLSVTVPEIEIAKEIKNGDKPKLEAVIPANIHMIDREVEQRNSEFLLDIYADDIHKFLKQLEAKQPVRKSYLTSAHIMTHHMRSVLVDWLFEVQHTFKLLSETIHLSIALLDRFMQDHPKIPKDELQLVGISCVFLASKYEEMYPPDLTDLQEISANAYSKIRIIKMEQDIFSSLDFQVGRPSPGQFLRRYSKAENVDMITYSLAKYFIDLSLVSYELCHVPPSLMAASALYLSLYLQTEDTESELWGPTLKYYSDYVADDLKSIVYLLAAVVWKAPESKYRNVPYKYLEPKRMHSVSAMKVLRSEKLYKLVQKV